MNNATMRDTFWAMYKSSISGKRGGYSPKEFAARIKYTGFVSMTEEAYGQPDPTSLKISDDELPPYEAVEAAIRCTWGQIAGDIEKNLALSGQEVTNEIAIGVCLDCDFLTGMGGADGKVANAAINAAYDRYGVDKVTRFLAGRVHLR